MLKKQQTAGSGLLSCQHALMLSAQSSHFANPRFFYFPSLTIGGAMSDDMLARISKLAETVVDNILCFASNELKASRDRPLAIQTYAVFHEHTEHASATLDWLQATRQSYEPQRGSGYPPRCDLCGDCRPLLLEMVAFADLPLHRTHAVLLHVPAAWELINNHWRQAAHFVFGSGSEVLVL